MQFLPYCVTVPVGVKVTFTNGDFDDHTVTAAQGQPETFDSGLLYPGQQFSYTFVKAETVRVHCRLHPQMTGMIVVQ
jgi:plastocyanin